MTEILKIIEASSFFEGLPKKACRRLAESSRRRILKKRDILFLEDTEGSSMFLLEDGIISLHKTTLDGSDVAIKTVRPGEVFAEVVLFEMKHYPVTATAVIESSVIEFERSAIIRLLSEADFRNDFIACLMKKQRYLAERVRYLSAYDVEQRFVLFLQEHYGRKERITTDMSRKDIATAIGATPETLSRLIQRLTADGLLEWKGRRLNAQPGLWERNYI